MKKWWCHLSHVASSIYHLLPDVFFLPYCIFIKLNIKLMGKGAQVQVDTPDAIYLMRVAIGLSLKHIDHKLPA